MTPPQATAEALIVFVHVPKTAGSTVNAYLSAGGPGIEHCENLIADPARLAHRVAGAQWVSGHVHRDEMAAVLARATDRPLRWFSLVRAPTAQVMSHYNWLIEIHHRSQQFYNSHPEPVREISAAIRASDNRDPAAVIANLQRWKGLFLNSQSAFVLGRDFSGDDQAMVEIVKTYEYLTDGKVNRILKAMTGTAPKSKMAENTSRYHFPPEVFQTPELVEFLKTHNRRDRRLVAQVRALNRQPAQRTQAD